MVHIDHGSRSKVVGLSWKSPSNGFQDPREPWEDSQDTEKEERNKPLDFARLYWFAKGGKKILPGAISKGKESGSMMGHSSKQSVKKRSMHEDSKEIEQV